MRFSVVRSPSVTSVPFIIPVVPAKLSFDPVCRRVGNTPVKNLSSSRKMDVEDVLNDVVSMDDLKVCILAYRSYQSNLFFSSRSTKPTPTNDTYAVCPMPHSIFRTGLPGRVSMSETLYTDVYVRLLRVVF